MESTIRIALLSSNRRGGTVQLLEELYKQFKKIGVSVECITPEQTKYNTENINKSDVYLYKRKALLNPLSRLHSDLFRCDSDAKELAEYIIRRDFSFVLTADTGSFSLKTIYALSKHKKRPYTFLSIHDAVPHSEHHNSIKSIYYFISSSLYRKKNIQTADYLVFFSKYNRDLFYSTFKDIHLPFIVCPLGAHIPDLLPEKPAEIPQDTVDFYLFFGRIEKYKNLGMLIHSYNSSGKLNHKLIIAGNGLISEEERNQISQNKNIILINRFISDKEMIWLFKHSRASILPYTDASQSGIIPISYYYKHPVITSNVEGLIQFVENNRTGIVCKTLEDYIVALSRLENDRIIETMSNNAYFYYCEHLDWCKTIPKLFDEIKKAIQKHND